MQNLPAEALLILDNASGHLSGEQLKSRDGLIEVMFLSPNCTLILQPMDENVMQFVKSRHKKSLLCSVISQNNDNIPMSETNKPQISHMHGKMYLLKP
jgi:hypothetical protein